MENQNLLNKKEKLLGFFIPIILSALLGTIINIFYIEEFKNYMIKGFLFNAFITFWAWLILAPITYYLIKTTKKYTIKTPLTISILFLSLILLFGKGYQYDNIKTISYILLYWGFVIFSLFISAWFLTFRKYK